MRATLRAMATGNDSLTTILDRSRQCPDASAAAVALNKAIDADRHAPEGGRILPPSGWVHPL